MAVQDNHKFTYAYISKDSGELSTVEVTLDVEEDKMRVFIQSSEGKDIEEDLPEILKQIEKNHFLKAGIDIQNDCKVYIKTSDDANNMKEVELTKL